MGLEINRKEFKIWIDALDSGKYSQTNGRLNDHSGYCCMGVGCEVLIERGRIEFADGFINGLYPHAQKQAPGWLKEIDTDFKIKTSKSLADLNDSEKFTFPEIATMLELVYIHKALN